MNKKTPIKYSITGAKKCKTESSREWVGLDQSRPVSQQILTTSLPKALTTLAFQTSWTSVQLKVRWELGSMKLNTPNVIIQQHMDQRKPGTQQTCLNKVNTWQALGETRRSCHAVSLLSLPGQRIIWPQEPNRSKLSFLPRPINSPHCNGLLCSKPTQFPGNTSLFPLIYTVYYQTSFALLQICFGSIAWIQTQFVALTWPQSKYPRCNTMLILF